jgi:hypothetical protein
MITRNWCEQAFVKDQWSYFRGGHFIEGVDNGFAAFVKRRWKYGRHKKKSISFLVQ